MDINSNNATRDNEGLDLHGPAIGNDRDYDVPGVHAPNQHRPLGVMVGTGR